MALFTSETKDALKKLAAKQYESTEDRDALLAKVAAADGLTARDIIWMLFRPDRALRDWGAAWLRRQNAPDLLDAFLVESKGKPDQAFRAAAASINAMRIPGVENRLLQLVSTTPPNKELQRTRFTRPVNCGVRWLVVKEEAWQAAIVAVGLSAALGYSVVHSRLQRSRSATVRAASGTSASSAAAHRR